MMACDDLKAEWVFGGQSGGSPGKPVVIIPPQIEASFAALSALFGQSDHSVLATGHVTVNVIYGQSSERVECCPICGKVKPSD